MMDKKRIEIIITVILTVVFVFAFLRTVKVVKRNLKPRPGAKAQKAALSVEAAQSSSAVSTPQAEGKQLQWKRDPFSGKIYSSSAEGVVSLDLKGILWDEQFPQALIEDTICREGDTIGGFSIIRIDSDRITINDGSRDMEIKLE